MRVLTSSVFTAIFFVGWSVAYPFNKESVFYRRDDSQFRADAIREAFQHAWNGYTKYAFPHDELHPVSNGHGDSRNGWGASAIDAFSTALVMRKADVVNQILNYIPSIDYSKTTSTVSLFETSIRYLAGMLSGYDLLKGPLAYLAHDSSKVDALLTQSKNVADVLKFAFNTPSGIPYNGINIETHEPEHATANGLAAAGSLVLEWTRLSDLTNNPEYANLTQKAQSYLLDPKPSDLAEPFPGLVGSQINIKSGLFQDGAVSWNGGQDSFYEYLLKMYLYDPERFATYKDRWVAAADSTIKHLQSHPQSRPDLTYLASYNNGAYDLRSQHLTCFDGGSFLLGGSILDHSEFVDFGLKLVEGCHETYSQTATGIGPEEFGWDANKVPSDQADLYHKAGFYIKEGSYVLRPEVLESFYYAYRISGQQKYRDWIWNAFVAINATCRTDSGFAGISNVNTAGGGRKDDNEESFLFAELLKYAYLAHAPDDEWQVQRGNDNTWVYNTEGHPLRVANPAT